MVLMMFTLFPLFDPSWSLHLNAFDSLVDGFEQGSVRRVLIALFVAEHVGQSVHIGVEILFTDGLLMNKNDKIAKGYPCSNFILCYMMLN